MTYFLRGTSCICMCKFWSAGCGRVLDCGGADRARHSHPVFGFTCVACWGSGSTAAVWVPSLPSWAVKAHSLTLKGILSASPLDLGPGSPGS